MKMYILILDDVPSGFAINSAAHASLACYLKFQDDPFMQDWVKHSFKKVVCKVNAKELAGAMESLTFHVAITESALDGRLVGAAFSPHDIWPDNFKFFKLYK